MSIQDINRLEKKGDMAGAARQSLELLLREGCSGGLSRIYVLNTRRLLAKLQAESREALAGEFIARDPELCVMLAGVGVEVKLPCARERANHDAGSPLVTVVVPCYNCEKYLPQTIESIAKQTYDNFECILVDDFSSDGTAAIAKSKSREDKRFRFYQHRSNGGLSASRNSGLRLSRGEYVCFIDSDDLLSPGSLEKRAKELTKYKNEECIAGTFDFSMTIPEDFNGDITELPARHEFGYVDFISAKGDCPFNANQPMLKRSVLVEMGGFPEKYRQAEDWRLWSKILRSGYVLVPVCSVGSGYRQTPGSMIRRAPLLHVKTSSGNYFRSHHSVEAENDPVEFSYEDRFYSLPIFSRECGYYTAQQAFAPRVFNFVGIELGRLIDGGRQLDMKVLADALVGVLPNLSLALSGYTTGNLLAWMANGCKRYFGVDSLAEETKQIFDKLAAEVCGAAFSGQRCLTFGRAKRVVPVRPIRRKDPTFVDVVFFPHKAYHTRSFRLLIPHLLKKGISFVFVDSSVPYRQEAAYDSEIDQYFLSYNEFVFSRIFPRSILCMNDWDTVVKPVIRCANKFGIPTIGVVEGVQDFGDVDTGRVRRPYREVENVFLPGDFDRKYFFDTKQNIFVTGVQRLDGLQEWADKRRERYTGHTGKVVVNVNFSYGVMTDKRDAWLSDISDVCNELGLRMVLSQHPQDDGDLSKYSVSNENLYDLLVDCDVFISRFSGAILESLVIGCSVIYYNGHGEKVDKFHDALGAYQVADDKTELRRAMRCAAGAESDPRAFLKQHCDMEDNGAQSLLKTVEAIADVLAAAEVDEASGTSFKKALGA